MNDEVRISALERELEATRRELEEARAEAARGRFFRKMVEASPDAIAVISREGKIVYASPGHSDLLGERFVGLPIGTQLHPDDVDLARRHIESLVTRGPGATGRIELRQRGPDGEYLHIEGTSRNLLDDPDVNGIAGYVRDISAQVAIRENLVRAHTLKEQVLRAELALADSERMFRALFETAAIAVTIRDYDTLELIDCNEAALRLFGCTSREELRAMPAAAPPELRARTEPHFAERIEWPMRRANGERFIADLRLTMITLGCGRRVLQTLVEDTTERTRAAEERRRRARRDEILSDVSRRFLNEDPEAATLATLARVGVAFDAERTFIFAPVGPDGHLRRTHGWLAPGVEDPYEDSATVPPEAFELAETMKWWVPDLERQFGERVLFAPIGSGGRVYGVLTVRAREGRSWTEDDKSAIQSVAEVVAVGRMRHAAELALARAKEDAVAASQSKSAFLANMSHELRTPLNGVIGMVDLLSKTVLDAQQRRYATVARASASLLLSVINDILDFSKLEVGKLEVESIEFTFQEIAEEVASLLAINAEDKGIELACDSSGLGMAVLGDPARLRQILVNLVSNAIKFTPQGEVTLRATLAAETETDVRARIEVRDTGIGIPAEAQSRLFVPFTQVDASTTRVHGGTGLGLAICRELVERMGGTIGVVSEPGAGATFWFEVPLAKAALPPLTEPQSVRRLAGVRVLAVDDNATNRELLQSQLTAVGMQCDTAPDGATALSVLVANSGERPYALALLDHHMPGMDGRELARRISTDARLRETRVVMLGSVAYPFSQAEQSELRIAGYCTKPIWRKQLLRVLVAVLDGVPIDDARAEASVEARPPTDARILLVEDSPINAEVASGILRSAGYELDLAQNGAEAVRMVAANTYGLVLMDCQLPEVDGYEATRRIRALPERGGLPIVALTASAAPDDLERCFRSGMDDHVAKPVDMQRLLDVIARHLGGQRGRRSERRPSGELPVADFTRALARLNGDLSLLERIAKQFSEGAGESWAKLRAAVLDRDSAAARFAAHRLAGQASSFDGAVLVDALRALQEMLLRNDWAAARDTLPCVEKELERLVRIVAAQGKDLTTTA